MLGTQLLACALTAARGSWTSRCIYRPQNTAGDLGTLPAQDFTAGIGYPFEWIQIPKFSSLGFIYFFYVLFCFSNAKIFKGNWGFYLFFSFFLPPPFPI